ncbi:MAG: hypothetical protein LBH25_04400 [Fibromonadaceae bacterium]|jgi:uncharacterized protein (TIGR02145 family)|nr:hypothetical protein [Fibromonadaceae bacterium]
MNKIHSKGRVSLPITLAASIALALAFTFNACSGGGGNELGYNPGTSSLCNGLSYDPSVHRCESGELVGKCKGEDYYPAYEQCVNGTVVPGAGLSSSSASSSNISAWQSSSSMASSNSNMLLSSSSIRSSSSAQYSGTFTDNRDNITYKWVRIGEQVWMAENLQYKTGISKCPSSSYGDDKCTAYNIQYSYGKLYDWATAMALTGASYCNETIPPDYWWISCTIETPHKGICPEGWHIPTKAEWEALISYVENDKKCSNCAWEYLRSKFYDNGWDRDPYGFSGLIGSYDNGGSSGYWIASISDDSKPYKYAGSNFISSEKINFYNVRCAQNDLQPSSSSVSLGCCKWSGYSDGKCWDVYEENHVVDCLSGSNQFWSSACPNKNGACPN